MNDKTLEDMIERQKATLNIYEEIIRKKDARINHLEKQIENLEDELEGIEEMPLLSEPIPDTHEGIFQLMKGIELPDEGNTGDLLDTLIDERIIF